MSTQLSVTVVVSREDDRFVAAPTLRGDTLRTVADAIATGDDRRLLVVVMRTCSTTLRRPWSGNLPRCTGPRWC